MSLSGSGGSASIADVSQGGVVEWLDLKSRFSVTAGYMSARYNTVGLYNLVVGYSAAASAAAVSGNNNVVLGSLAAFSNQGDYNVWVGTRAGFQNLSGSQNVGVGWSAGGKQTASYGNTSLGFQSGFNAVGNGNVSIGNFANAAGTDSATHCNIAIGASAVAGGGDSLAIGCDTVVSGGGAVALGPGNTASGTGSTVIGGAIDSSGARSLYIMPTRGASAFSGTRDGELNVYGVLTGTTSADDGSFGAELSAETLDLGSRHTRVSCRDGAISVTAASNVAVLSPAVFGSRATFNDSAVFSGAATFAGGVVASGAADFHGAVTFHGAATFADSSVLRVASADVERLRIGSLAVTGALDIPEDAVRDPLFQTTRTMGEATFHGHAAFKGGVHVCCQPLEADTAIAHTLRAHHLYVDGDFSVSNAVVNLADVKIGRAAVDSLVAAAGYFSSNLHVSGDVTGNGTLYYPNAFIGALSTSSAIHTPALYSSNIVCDTITVTGQNTALKVAGTSLLNATETNTLRVLDDAVVRRASVEEDIWVGRHTNTGTLTVREGSVMTHLTAELLKASSIRGGDAAITRVEVHGITGVNAAFSNLTCSNLAASNVASGSGSIGSLTSSDAYISRLRVDSLTLAGGIDASAMSLSNVTLAGTTTAAALHVTGNAAFDGDVTVSGTLHAGAIEVTGGYVFNSGTPVEFHDGIAVNNDVVVNGRVFGGAGGFGSLAADTLAIKGHASFGGCVRWVRPGAAEDDYDWDACLTNVGPETSDLQFTSRHGTVMTLTDEFEPGVLNFTGKHRCSLSGPAPDVGLLVVAAGDFNNLDGSTEPSMDEALPVVALATSPNDPRAYGVVAGMEAAGSRQFRVANMVFSTGHSGAPKVVLNSVGEGGMWVCDANGPVDTGDLLTTSGVAGHAQRQPDDVVRAATVGKVSGTPRRWQPYCDPVSGLRCMRAFAGVVYKF